MNLALSYKIHECKYPDAHKDDQEKHLPQCADVILELCSLMTGLRSVRPINNHLTIMSSDLTDMDEVVEFNEKGLKKHGGVFFTTNVEDFASKLGIDGPILKSFENICSNLKMKMGDPTPEEYASCLPWCLRLVGDLY